MNAKKYDLIIIGAGILGTFHAFHALKKGLKVLHLERDNFPVGSTVRNFGQIVPSGMSGKWFDYALRGLDIYKSIQREFDISVRNNGSYYISSDEQETQLLHELSTHYDSIKYEHQLWDKKKICAKFPQLNPEYAKEALVFEQELSVEPTNMIRRLHEYLEHIFSNYTLQYNTTVLACDSNSSTVQVRTTHRHIYEADKVIICNGYEFKLLYKELFEDSKLQISKLQMLRTSPNPHIELPGNILTGLTIRRYESFQTHCPSFEKIQVPEHYKELTKWGIHLLFKQEQDGSIVIGDSHEYAKGTQLEELGFTINTKINDLIWEEANRIMNLKQVKITSSWTGYYAQHEDNIVEKNIDSRIHIRTGIGGKGMTASAGYAEQSIADIYNL